MLLDEVIGQTEGLEYGQKSYMLGIAYKNLSDSDNALKWFIESAKNDYGIDAFWEMAYMLKKKERYEDAILSFQRLRNMTNREDLIAQEIEKCRLAIKMHRLGDTTQISVVPMPLNSEALDYSPQIYQDKYIVFTSDREQSTGALTYLWTGNKFSDLYKAGLDGTNVELFDKDINSIHNEGTACFNRDGTEMFYTFCHSETGDSYCRIVRRTLTEKGWTEPELVFKHKPKVNYGDPVLIEKDEVLIFITDDPTGIGGHDLYYSVIESNGQWSDPELMPSYLNTSGNERFPTWHDGYMYYSSDHFAGLGGLDIYRTKLREDGSWTRPENMSFPFNSSEDDYGLIFLPDSLLPITVHKAGFFTSSRGIYGGDDIYSFVEYFPEGVIRSPIVALDTVVNDVPIIAEKKYFLLLRVKEHLYANPDNPNSYVVGTKAVDNAFVQIKKDGGQEMRATDKQGLFLLPISEEYRASFVVGKTGYLNQKHEITIDTRSDDFPDGFVYEYDLTLDKIYEGIDIVLDDIYYEFNEAAIREDAKPALDKLVEILENNPGIRLELSAHTDCRGEEQYNLDLSEARAASAVGYLIGRNALFTERLQSKGYGESQPEVDCVCERCSEDEHQLNRRTTFKIVR